MFEETKIEEAQIIPNNNSDLYVVEPIKSGDDKSVYEFRLVPIVGWYVNTSQIEPYGKFFSDAFAITAGQLSEDDPIIFDRQTKHWFHVNSMGTGEDELLNYLNES